MGHHVPEGTILMVNLWSALHDPKKWPDPDKFDPTRFLDDEGKLKIRDDCIPFSIGRRVCLGEQLAKSELFLLITHVIHEFRITIPDDCTPTMKPVAGITTSPHPYKISLHKR